MTLLLILHLALLDPSEDDTLSALLVLWLPAGPIPWEAPAGDIRQEENSPIEAALCLLAPKAICDLPRNQALYPQQTVQKASPP